MRQISEIREQASDIGVFFPLSYETDSLAMPGELHGQAIATRNVLMMQCGHDADASGAPTAQTVARYQAAVLEKQYSVVLLEPAAIAENARRHENDLVISEQTQQAFAHLIEAIKQTAQEQYGTEPLIVALLDHAGHRALYPVSMEHSPSLPTDARILTDDELTALVINCGHAAKFAEQAGADGVALNAADRSLFGESLAAFHRDGKFGGDFDDRTRFVRDCYTAMKMLTADSLFYTIRLTLSDGVPQPDGWGMAFEDSTAPELYEPALLLKIMQTLYGIELVFCAIGIPQINWMLAAEPESDLIRMSRLCTCVAMLDSDLQQNVQLVVPEISSDDIPFANLASGMIAGEFASFGGFLG